MNNTLKFILVFIGSGAALFLIFYFYPAEIFDAKAIGKTGDEVPVSLSMRAFLGRGELPSSLNPENVAEIKRSLSGWMILFICVIGLPFMIAYRSILTKREKKSEE